MKLVLKKSLLSCLLWLIKIPPAHTLVAELYCQKQCQAGNNCWQTKGLSEKEGAAKLLVWSLCLDPGPPVYSETNPDDLSLPAPPRSRPPVLLSCRQQTTVTTAAKPWAINLDTRLYSVLLLVRRIHNVQLFLCDRRQHEGHLGSSKLLQELRVCRRDSSSGVGASNTCHGSLIMADTAGTTAESEQCLSQRLHAGQLVGLCDCACQPSNVGCGADCRITVQSERCFFSAASVSNISKQLLVLLLDELCITKIIYTYSSNPTSNSFFDVDCSNQIGDIIYASRAAVPCQRMPHQCVCRLQGC